jgi:AraC-like DNA-binding protein
MSLREFFTRLSEPFTAERLFDALPTVVFFIKNDQGEYLVVNRTLMERCGAKQKSELIGLTADRVFPPPLGRSFWEQDMKLIGTGVPMVNQLELHLYPTGVTGWCLTEKLPLRDATDRVIGLAGISHDLHLPDENGEEYRNVAEAVKYAKDNLHLPLAAGELAKVANLSTYQLDRRIRRLFQLSTGQLLLKLRMEVAADMLRHGNRTFSEIGTLCGYSDQSAFSRQFRRTTGLTPGEYRRNFHLPSDSI